MLKNLFTTPPVPATKKANALLTSPEIEMLRKRIAELESENNTLMADITKLVSGFKSEASRQAMELAASQGVPMLDLGKPSSPINEKLPESRADRIEKLRAQLTNNK